MLHGNSNYNEQKNIIRKRNRLVKNRHNHYKTGEQIEMVVASLLLFLFVNSTLLINKRVYKILKELEELEN